MFVRSHWIRATHKAVAAHHFTFEMEDARGNKIFRKPTQTDTYGVASAEFNLADEVNLGRMAPARLVGTSERHAQPRRDHAERGTLCPAEI